MRYFEMISHLIFSFSSILKSISGLIYNRLLIARVRDKGHMFNEKSALFYFSSKHNFSCTQICDYVSLWTASYNNKLKANLDHANVIKINENAAQTAYQCIIFPFKIIYNMIYSITANLKKCFSLPLCLVHFN